jgi:hypothetical protein
MLQVGIKNITSIIVIGKGRTDAFKTYELGLKNAQACVFRMVARSM